MDHEELIYEVMDLLMRRGAFQLIDTILDAIDTSELTSTELLAFLSITRTAKDCLRSRAKFAVKVRAHLVKVNRRNVEELMFGLD